MRLSLLALAGAWGRELAAQTDYFNLDAGRPLRVEDALVIERHAFEWQVAPLRFSRGRGGTGAFGVEPELAWGLFPRTQVEVGVPLLLPRGGTLGAAGVEVTALHALNAESTSWPGLAIKAGVHTPAGPHGPTTTRTELGAIATRTMSQGRVHANATWHPSGGSDEGRWSAGLAADHTFPLRSMLVGAEVVVDDAGVTGVDPRWSLATGMRYQLGPRSAVDFGVGRTLGTGGEWSVTMGSAVSFGLWHRLGGGR